jgi:hypothetical protein
MAKGMVRKDKIKSTYNGNLESVKHSAELQNGNVVFIGDLAAGEREVRNVVIPLTAALPTGKIYLIGTGELTYRVGETYADFSTPIGGKALAYELAEGDVFTVSTNVITGTAEVGKYLIPTNASLQMSVANDASGTSKFAAKIIELTTIYGGYAAAVVRVERN